MTWITNTELIIILLGLAVCGKQLSVDSHGVVGTIDSTYFDNSSVEMKDDSAITHFIVNNAAGYVLEEASLDTIVNISGGHELGTSRLGDVDHPEKETISFSNSNSTPALVDITTTTYYPGTEATDYFTHDSTGSEVETEYATTEFGVDCENSTSSLCEEGTCCLDTTTSLVKKDTILSNSSNYDSAGNEETTPLVLDAGDKESTLPSHMYFNSVDSEYRKVENGSVVFHSVENASMFPATYYYCFEMEEKGKSLENIRITCNCNGVNEKHCCTMGLLLFSARSGSDYWQCNTFTYSGQTQEERTSGADNHERYQNGFFPHVLLPSNYPCNSCDQDNHWDYVIVKGAERYNSSTFKVEDKLFQEEYFCKKTPNETGVFLCAVSEINFEMYEAMNILCIIFYSVTLVVFSLLPDMRTMKTRILICQTVSFLALNFVNLRFYAAEAKLQEMECILSGYANHYFSLASCFWINVLCIDMAWTFRGVQFQRGDRWKFRVYSLYAWGTPLVIAVLTAILEFTSVGKGSSWKPIFRISSCWFADLTPMIIFHYGPYLALTLINGPLLGFVIFKISRALCASAVLENNGSGRHSGSNSTKKKKKKKTRRFVIYTNLALLIGAPRILTFIKLMTDNERLLLIINIITMLRSVSFFLFVCCRRKVLILLKQRISNWSSLIPHTHTRQEKFKMSASETATTATEVSSSEMQTTA